MRARLPFLVFFCAVSVLSVFLYVRSGNISSEDGFYHFRHAAIYAERGIGISEFPWIPYSVISRSASDIWYGFHVLLIPFTFVRDPVLGLRLGGIAITLATLLIFYWALARLGIRYRFLWPFFLLFSSPYILYRLAMVRPHALSMGIAALLFSFLVSGAAAGIFWASFAFVFLHLSLFWIPIVIFAVFVLIKIFTQKSWEWRPGAAMVAGLAAGWLARPHPFGAAKIAYVQIVQLIIEKFKGTPLHFGMELYPMAVASLIIFWGFMIAWIAAGCIFLRAPRSIQEPRLRTIVWASGILSLLFFVMTIVVAERSFDFWAVFGTLFIAGVVSGFFAAPRSSGGGIRSNTRVALAWLGAAIFSFMILYGLYQQGSYLENLSWDPARFKGASSWLRSHAEPDAIVFNVSWDYFPELFFWNNQNRYISGMDPIFQFAYNPALYWEAYYLETGKTTSVTCSSTRCEAKELKDTYAVLKNDFKASYIFLSKPADQNLYRFASEDRRFAVRYDDANAAIFELK